MVLNGYWHNALASLSFIVLVFCALLAFLLCLKVGLLLGFKLSLLLGGSQSSGFLGGSGRVGSGFSGSLSSLLSLDGLVGIALTVTDAALLHLGSLSLAGRRQLAMQILLHHQSTDGHTIVGTPSTILHIHTDGYLRVIHRSETHKHGVVVAAVLSGTCLDELLYVVVGQVIKSSFES